MGSRHTPEHDFLLVESGFHLLDRLDRPGQHAGPWSGDGSQAHLLIQKQLHRLFR